MTEQDNSLFGDTSFSWKKEWKNMPEFVNEDLTPFRTIIVHFRNQADVIDFAQKINQNFRPKQKSTWYPDIDKRVHADKKWF